MSPIGVKACSIECEGGWQGFYRIPLGEKTVEGTINIIRKSSYDAWSDACQVLKKWSVENNTPLILDYYQLCDR